MVIDMSVLYSDIQLNNYIETTINHKSRILGNDSWILLNIDTVFGSSYAVYINGQRKELTKEEKNRLRDILRNK